MARTSRRKSKGIDAAQRVLSYVLTPSSGAVTVDIDLAKDLSAVNRRLYRQGMQYYVTGVSFLRLIPGVSAMSALTAGDTWVVHNAWTKGRALWLDQQRTASKAVGIPMGTWADFKVTLDDASSSAISTVSSDGGTIVPDEWNYSELVYELDGVEQSPIMNLIGPSNQTSVVGLIHEYSISRALVQDNDPDVPADASDSIYAKMALMGSDELSDILIDDIESHNDSPPYDQNEMVGGDTVADAPFLQDMATAFYEAGRTTTSGFTAECGLLRLILGSFEPDGTTASDTPHLIQVHIAPGSYKGVMASPMGQ